MGRVSTANSLREFDCSNGIADIVFYSLRTDWKKNSTIGQIPPRWAFALKALPYRKSFRVEDFKSWSGASLKKVLESLHLYEDLGYVESRKDGSSWIKLFQPKPLTKKIFSVEAKLRDWKNALYQANRYKYFSHQSWVLLDDYYSSTAIDNLQCFDRLNVGLASLNQNGDLAIHHSPCAENPKSDMYYWQANALIGSDLMSH